MLWLTIRLRQVQVLVVLLGQVAILRTGYHVESLVLLLAQNQDYFLVIRDIPCRILAIKP
jgi:hypothetical protein